MSHEEEVNHKKEVNDILKILDGKSIMEINLILQDCKVKAHKLTNFYLKC